MSTPHPAGADGGAAPRRWIWRAAILLGLVAAAVGAAYLVSQRLTPTPTTATPQPPDSPPPPPLVRPIFVMSSFPMQFTQGISFDPARAQDGSAQFRALRAAGNVTVIDSFAAAKVPANALLFLAHPRALAPADLMAIDRWVRAGGRALILADGLYTGAMPHPLGNPRNPPLTSLLTPLLTHWGVTLDGPTRPDATQAVRDVMLVSPGRLRLSGGDAPGAATGDLRADGAIARLTIGKGRVTIIADADFYGAADAHGAPDDGAAHPDAAPRASDQLVIDMLRALNAA